MTAPCPLCDADDSVAYHRDARRAYRQCPVCALVFVPAAYWLSHAAEKAEYLQHQNAVDDPGYRRFLQRMAEPLLARLPPQQQGLDFGCGPAPALAAMLTEAGHQVALYDCYFYPDARVLKQVFDFVVATEVVEHLAAPGKVLATLWSCLRPGGCLGIMTKRVLNRERFAQWHYIRDPTHIAFFSDASFRWLADQWHARLEFVDRDVVLLHKPQPAMA